MSPQYGELRPASCWDRSGSLRHPCKFQRILRLGSVTARHLVVGVSQTLRRWTEGATYVRQGDRHVGHWPTFLVSDRFSYLLSLRVTCVMSGDAVRTHRQQRVHSGLSVPVQCRPGIRRRSCQRHSATQVTSSEARQSHFDLDEWPWPSFFHQQLLYTSVSLLSCGCVSVCLCRQRSSLYARLAVLLPIYCRRRPEVSGRKTMYIRRNWYRT